MLLDTCAEEMTPEERLQHVAAVFARGVLRHHRQRQRDGRPTSEDPSKSDSPGLDVSVETSLTVPTG
mgnify:CR=1 FL=1